MTILALCLFAPLFVPATLSPTLPVPKSIARPEYAWQPTVKEGTEPWVQTPEVIEKMRVAGRIAAGALAEAGKAVAPGVTTDELDRIAHDYMVDHGAYPSTLGYKGFPKSCCTSLNEIICHGIPDSTVVQDGDIVNIDVTAYIDGVHGDTNATFLAGDVSEEHRLLVERTHEATMRAIKAVKPGRSLSVVGRVIESYANRFGYNVVRDFTGHGIGTTFHNGLVVLHYDQPAIDTVLEPGMTFTIEPMINLGALDYEIWDDGWTVATDGQEVDGAVRAHPGGHRRRRRHPDAGLVTAPSPASSRKSARHAAKKGTFAGAALARCSREKSDERRAARSRAPRRTRASRWSSRACVGCCPARAFASRRSRRRTCPTTRPSPPRAVRSGARRPCRRARRGWRRASGSTRSC